MQDKLLDDLKRLISLPMNSFPLGVGVIDRDLRLQYVNEQKARLDGFIVAETLGRHIADIGPSLAAAAGLKIQFFLDTGVPLRNQKPIGQPPSMTTVTAPLFAPSSPWPKTWGRA